MKINKNSLHYKLYKFTWIYVGATNLCSYFWGLVTAIPALLFLLPGRIIYERMHNSYDCENQPVFLKVFIYLLTTFFALVGSMALGIILGKAIYHHDIVLALVASVAITGGLCYVGWRIKHRNEEKFDVVAEYVWARKRKVCPRITFIDDEE